MNIAFMFYDGSFYIGGPTINAIRLLPEFVKRGNQVTAIVLAYNGESMASNILKNAGVNCIVFPIPQYREKLMLDIIRIVQEHVIDVFIPNICLSGLFVAKWIKCCGIPTIAVQRGADERNFLIAKIFGLKTEWQTSGIVFVSKFLQDETINNISYNINSVVIPSGVPLVKEYSNQNENGLKCVYSGRLVENIKNISHVFELFKIIIQNFGLECSFIGSGEEEENLKNLAVLNNISNKINFFGHLNGDDYKKTLIRHHFILLCSDSEGTPGSIMDAMSCGLIPICMKYKGIEELVINNENGYVFSDYSEVVAIISSLINNCNLRNQVSQNAIDHISNNFSLEVTTNRWLKFINELVITNTIPKQNIKIPSKFNGNFPSKLIGCEPPVENQKYINTLKLLYKKWKKRIKSRFAL